MSENEISPAGDKDSFVDILNSHFSGRSHHLTNHLVDHGIDVDVRTVHNVCTLQHSLEHISEEKWLQIARLFRTTVKALRAPLLNMMYRSTDDTPGFKALSEAQGIGFYDKKNNLRKYCLKSGLSPSNYTFLTQLLRGLCKIEPYIETAIDLHKVLCERVGISFDEFFPYERYFNRTPETSSVEVTCSSEVFDKIEDPSDNPLRSSTLQRLWLQEALAELSPRERWIVEKRAEGIPLRELGLSSSPIVTGEAIRLVQEKALSRMRRFATLRLREFDLRG